MLRFLSIIFFVLHQIYAAPSEPIHSERSMFASNGVMMSSSNNDNTMVMTNPHTGQAMVMNPAMPSASGGQGSGSSMINANPSAAVGSGQTFHQQASMINANPSAAVGSGQTFQQQASVSNGYLGDSIYNQISRYDKNPRLRLYGQQWGLGSSSSLAKNAELSIFDSVFGSLKSFEFPSNPHSYWSMFLQQPNQNTMVSSGNSGVMLMNSGNTRRV